MSFEGRLEGMWILLTLHLVIELLLTAAFVFSVFMLATEKHKVLCPPSIHAVTTCRWSRLLITLTEHLTCWHRSSSLHCTTGRQSLHRSITESGTLVRRRCRCSSLPRLSLDLLARTFPRQSACRWLLQSCQDS